MPKVSVIMSVRNGGNYLQECLRSILNQSYRNFELIVINDASTDNTAEILKNLKDKRLKIITNNKKKGLTKSLNLALKIASGLYIARMDHDDISQINRFKIQTDFLAKHKEIGVLGSSVYLIDQQGKKRGVKKFPFRNKEILKQLFKYNPLRHSTVMLRKDLITKFGSYDEKLDGAEDYDLWLRLAKYTKLANIGLPLLSYRIHGDRVSEKEEKKVLVSAYKARIKAIFVYKYPLKYLPVTLLTLISAYIPAKLKRFLYNVKLLKSAI